MDFIRLLLGLLLPWIGGYYWLVTIENRFSPDKTPNRLRQLGYGLFLGYAGLQGIILASATVLKRVDFWPVIAVIALITSAAALLPRTSRQLRREQAPHHRASPAARILFAILLSWATLHLVLAAIEILNRPVYPWDAWLAWIYRAKAWFFSSNVYQLASPTDWLAGTATSPYTIDAHGYPTFASIIPFWAALSLGRWSETLVNTPVLCCAVALGLGIYGQCREQGIPPLLSIAAAYFLLSIPLVGTHLSLAGYADIWLAGFTGLGFAALIPALANKNKLHILLGLGMLALGIGVKNEGTVWFYLALAVLLLSTIRSRIVLAALAGAVLLGIASWTSGFTYLEVPFAGGVGVLNGKVHIPFAGSHQIQVHNILLPYFSSFFAYGSWHLLWSLLLFLTGSLYFLRKSPIARVMAIFLLLILASQAFIFGFTEQGRWATSYTAINRLPMHFVPAIVLCLFIALHKLFIHVADDSSDKKDTQPKMLHLIQYSLPAIIAVLLVAIGATTYLLPDDPTSTNPRQFFAKDLQLVVGGGKIHSDTAYVTHYERGFAIISSGPISIPAKDLPVLTYDLESSHPKPPLFFWRTASNPDDIEIADIQPDNAGTLRLSGHPSWEGEITEIGITLYGNQGQSAQIRQLSLMPETLLVNFTALWRGWTTFNPWSQASVNWLAGGRTGLAIPAPILLALWLMGSLSLYLLASRFLPSRKSMLTAFSICILIAWGLIDLRWTVNRLEQARLTLTNKELRGEKACIDPSFDCKLAELVSEVRHKVVNGKGEKILIVQESPEDIYRALRIKYRLLPSPAIAYGGSRFSLPKGGEDYILLLNKIELSPGDQGEKDSGHLSSFRSRKNISVNTLWERPDSALYKVQREKK